MGTTNVCIRMDEGLKREAEALFSDLGLSMTSALTMFIKQAVRTQGIPFTVSRILNAETVAAMKEAERIAHDPNVQGYTDMRLLLEDLRA